MSSILKESATQLRKLVDDTQKHIRVLKTLGEPVENWNSLIIHIIVSRVDANTKREWETETVKKEAPTLQELLEFLSQWCVVLESLQSNRYLGNKPALPSSTRRGENHVGAHASQFVDKKCPLCQGHHEIYSCKNFKDMTVQSRINEQNTRSVRWMDSKQEETSSRGLASKSIIEENNNNNNRSQRIEQKQYSVNSSTLKFNNQVLVATASVKLNERGIDVSLSGVGGGVADANGVVNTTISSAINEFKIKLRFLVMDHITERMPSQRINIATLNIPRNIRLSDRQFGDPGEIDILLGGGVFWDLLCVGQIKLGRGLPILQKTKFGWIVAEGSPIIDSQSNGKSTALCTIIRDTELLQQIERFWTVEEGPSQIIKAKLTREELLWEEEFRDTHYRMANGRFVVRLPCREELDCLGDSREFALKRLHSILRRLDRDPELKTQYTQEYLKSGHMSKVHRNAEFTDEIAYYLPHHAVVKEERTTTKLRVVFDVFCKTTTGKSLNDILTIRVGPTIQSELFEIILRFRQHQYVLTGDIEQMYRQIYVDPKQRNLQRVLWKNDSTSQIEEFVLNTVTFGVASASFLAVTSDSTRVTTGEPKNKQNNIKRFLYGRHDNRNR
ncbi:PREDICTED: uncharacterized protein LOC105458736 [Wasmannia auropunctata]|uniref:uncharacterized protein LOC105458736 n=1 Tax=Wasmannia auropunctata TaxID=64793 RepID=UPI0005F04D71|nr:PREDICTED: uncharacterized protein LOC105458736 [Wasmannia auropunctata]